MSPLPGLAGRLVAFERTTATAAALARRQVTRDDVAHALTPTDEQRTILIVIGAYALGILVLWNIPYINMILLPFKLVTVALHEFSHAAAGLCTGARIKSITIDPDEGGLTRMNGGKWCCVMPAGYLGSALLGALMVFAGFDVLASKIVSVIIGVCLLATLFWAKSWFTRLITVLFIGLIVGLWFTPQGAGLRYVVLFMGVMSSLYSLWDIVDDTLKRKVNESDATKFAQKTHCSSRFCGAADANAFSLGVAQWVEHCLETVDNTEGAAERYGSSDELRMRVSTALTETIWALNIEWEPDTADDNDQRWDSDRLERLERSRQLVEMAKCLVSAGVISLDLAKERLDADFLEQMNAVPSAVAFTRKYIRLNTTLNFKQTKYNLISEQNEGFAKLVVLIQGAMAAVAPHQLSSDLLNATRSGSFSNDNGSVVMQALRTLDGLQQRVRMLIADILRLVGIFNIDPNRVLDIIIDCFISSVRFYWPFYLALLDASPWCQRSSESPKIAQLVGWKMQFYAGESVSAFKFLDELSTVAALLVSHGIIRLADLYPMLSPSRNEDMSKEFDEWCSELKNRQSQGGGNSLAEMGGLEEVSDDKPAKPASQTDSRSEWSNQHALLCAKLLAIGNTDNALVYIKRFPSLARMHPQIADLTIRIVDVATADLYRNTDCVRAPVKPYLRIHSNALAETADHTATGAWGIPCSRLTPALEAHTNRNYVLSPPLPGSTDVFFYEDFWQLEAETKLPRAHSVASLPRDLAPWLNVGFTRLHLSPSLLTRLMRLCRYGLQSQPEAEHTWQSVLRAWILPAYSLTAPSAGLSNELWLIVSMMPQAKRYALYRDWNTMLTSGHPTLPHTVTCEKPTHSANPMDMAMSLDDALEEVGDADGLFAQTSYVEIEALCLEVRRQVRAMMRRLSGDTVKLIGRQLCALCHPTPTLSLKVVLDQVCSYDNLIDSVVEAFRYLTPLDADVMFYVILNTLDDPASTKVKEDGINTAHWLQSLSLFIAAFGHRHENASLSYTLSYVLKQVVRMVRIEEAPPVFETTVISDAILRLAAIDVMANATDDQVLALQGGYHLNLEAFSMVSPWVLPQDATVDSALAASTNFRLTRRLAQWLTNIVVGNDLALSLVVAMCTHADKILKMASLPLSNVMIIYDREIERVYQLFNLLYTNLKPDRYASIVPGPHILVSKYNLSWGLAILWGRPNISRHLIHGLKQWEEDGEPIAVQITEQEGALASKGAMAADGAQISSPLSSNQRESTDAANASGNLASAAAKSSDTNGVAAESDSVSEHKAPAAAAVPDDSKMDIDEEQANDEHPRIVSDLKFEAPLLPRDYVSHIASTVPQSAIEVGLSPEFVAVFWTLSLYDIEVPADRYAKEIDIHTHLIKRIDGLAKTVSGSRSKAAALSQMRLRATGAVESLTREMLEQKQHVSRIRRWLIAQKDYWFCMAHEQRRFVIQALLQHCILPRAVLSASDASFCAKFLWMMHFPLATNKFSLMIVYDNVFSESLSTLLAAFTENEARNYAKFLNTSLAYLAPLHSSESNYKERAVNTWRGLTGFQQHWRYERGYLPPKSRTILQQMPAQPSESSGDERRIKPGSVMLSYDDFRTVMRKWQVNLTKAFITTLEMKRNDTVRNGILALKEMQKSFPVILQYGRRIMDKVNEVASGGASVQQESTSDGDGSPESAKNLKVLASSYGAYLSMAKKNWIPEASYYPVPARSSSGRSAQPPPSRSATRQSSRESVVSSGAAAEPSEGKDSRSSKHDAGSKKQVGSDGSGPKSRQKSAANRSGSGGHIAAAAAAAAEAATAAARTGSSVSGGSAHAEAKGSAQRHGRSEGSGRNGSTGSGREQEATRARERDGSWGRNRDRQRGAERPSTPASKRPRISGSGHAKSLAASEAHQEPAESVPPVGPASKMTSEDVDRKRKELRAQLLKQQEEKQKQAHHQPAEAASERRDRGGRGAGGSRQGQESTKQRESEAHGGKRTRYGDHPSAQAEQRRHGRGNGDSGPHTPQGGRGGRYSLSGDSTPFSRNSGGRQGRQDGGGKAQQSGRKGQDDGGSARRGPKRGRGPESREWDDGKRHRR
ncbi:THO2 plays a role in transcriptional elongation [Coemansia sp. RSA 2336]|nr:THO2 plays a role in transcriptional elongation [Coemansia sp. RSA 2336]